MKQIIAICCLSATCLSATAQSINIKGKVTDGKEPIIGATISVEGSNRNAVTDIDGNYSIEVPAGGTLTYSYVGYHQVKKKVKQGGWRADNSRKQWCGQLFARNNKR